MITLIKFRKDKLINSRKCFKDEKEVEEHINFIEKEIKISQKESRMLELKNCHTVFLYYLYEVKD